MDFIGLTFVLFGSLLLMLFLGIHVAFALGGLSVAYIYIFMGDGALTLIPLRVFRSVTAFEYTAIPMFIFMGVMLQRSGLAEDLFGAMSSLFRKVRGGLAAGTIGVCTVFSCMSGISGAATVSMGIVAVPAMLKRGYSKQIALGSVAAGGSLGILIPPSVTMIVYGVVSGTSIGRLYAAGVLPGLLLSLLFTAYVLAYARFRRNSIDDSQADTALPLLDALSKFLIPIVLIFLVLGSIMIGFASIGESAALGALGSAVVAWGRHGRNYFGEVLPQACKDTLLYSCLIFWIIMLATSFSTFYSASGASRFIESLVLGMDVHPYVILLAMMLILLVMGMVLDTVGIILITVPIFVPIANALDFNPVWFGILFIINMEIGFLTPPFGYNLIYLKGVAPKGVTMGDIYKSVTPFIIIMMLAILICTIFPDIVLVLPNALFG